MHGLLRLAIATVAIIASIGCHGGSAGGIDGRHGGGGGGGGGCATGSEVTLIDTFDGAAGTATTTADIGGVQDSSAIVELVPGAVAFRDPHSHQLIASSSADAFWTSAGVAGAPNASAQRGLYDALTARYFLSAEERTPGPNRIYLAISLSSDPTGPWKSVTLPAQSTHLASTHLASDRNGVYVTADAPDHGVVLALPLADLTWTPSVAPSAAHLNVATTTRTGLVPAASYTADVVLLARDAPTTGNTTIAIYPLTWSATTASLGAAKLVDLGARYVLPSRTAVQPAPAPRLDPGTGAIASASAAVDSIVGVATTEVAGRLAVLWFELDRSGVGGQVGVLSDPAADLLAPAIATTIQGEIGVVATRVADAELPGVVVTGRTRDNPFGMMRPLVVARAGTAPYSCQPVGGVSPFAGYASISAGFAATAALGHAGNCAFDTAWVHFEVLPRDPCAD